MPGNDVVSCHCSTVFTHRLQLSATAAADTNSSDGGRGRRRKGRREELVSLLRDYCTAGSRPLPPSPGHAPDHTPLEDSLAREMDTSADVSLSQSEVSLHTLCSIVCLLKI